MPPPRIFTFAAERAGAFLKPVSQSVHTYGTPTKS